MLGLTVNDENGFPKVKWSVIGTYLIIFLINLIYDIVSAGGISALSWIFLGDSALKAFFITLVIFASNTGIKWKQGQV